MLSESVASLLAQDVPIRVLLVDNASTVPLDVDPSVEVVSSPARLSLGAARNYGLERVETPYVMFWDADDVMLAGSLARLERSLDSNAGTVASAAAIVEDSGERHRWPRLWIASLLRAPRVFALAHCVWSLYPTTGATLIRTDALRAGGGFGDAMSGDDWIAGVSLAFRGRLRWSEQPGRVYRRQGHSIWADYSTPVHLSAHARAVRKRIRRDPGIPAWAKLMLPLIALVEYAAIAGHVLVSAVRRARRV
jgi:glycosyltransferase involved in cell wall biosynthesis